MGHRALRSGRALTLPRLLHPLHNALFLVAAAAHPLAAQPIRPTQAIGLADSLAQTGTKRDLRRSIELWATVARFYQRTGQPALAATAHEKIAAAWIDLDLPRRAGTQLASAVRLRRTVADSVALARTLRLHGTWYTEAGAARRAVPILVEAWAIARGSAPPDEKARIALELASASYELDRLTSAADWMDSSSVQFERAGDAAGAARMSNLAANLADDLGAAERSEAAAARALRLSREAGHSGHQAEALALLALNAGHRGAVDTAISLHRSGAEAYREAGDIEGQANAASNLGTLFVRLGLSDSAKNYFEAALRLADSAGDVRTRALVLGNLASTVEDWVSPDSATRLHRASLAAARLVGDPGGEFAARLGLARATARHSPLRATRIEAAALAAARRDGNSIRVAVASHALGQSLTGLGQTDSARRLLRRAQRLYRAADQPLYLAEVLADLARLERSRGHVQRAVQLFDSAAAERSRVGSQTGADFLRLAFEEGGADLFADWVEAVLTLGGGSAPATSLAVVERGRAQALRNLMTEGTAAPVAPGGDLAAETAGSIAQALAPDEAALIYLVGPRHTFVWSRPPNGELSVRTLAIGSDSLAAAVTRLRETLGVGATGESMTAGQVGLERGVGPRRRPPSDSAWLEAARRIATILIPNEIAANLRAAREVLVIPDGVIALVPFAILPLGNMGETWTAAIRYGPSLATVAMANRQPVPVRSEPLVFGNPLMPELTSIGLGIRLQPLPFAESEAASVAGRLGARALVGSSATEAEFFARARRASVIHLASHGFAFSAPEQARRSFVALAADDRHDGLLQVGELLDLADYRLTADLVALSACQTGLGDVRRAEGTVGLQRAFLAKGARSVLVSLWSVDDRATGSLMDRFYAHWLDDTDRPAKPEALRRAQADLSAIPEWRSPAYWAGFQLVGAR